MNIAVEPQSFAAASVADSLAPRLRRVAEVAAAHCDAVDRDARFAREAVAALKVERLLGAMIPRCYGGEGLRLEDIADVCAALGAACSATGMTFAMHQIKAASLIEHGVGSAWHEALMRRIAADQLLIASSTTEAGIGGDLRRSICAVETVGDMARLTKEASVISYGAHADLILATARRASDAPASDQVLVALLRGQYTLERTSTWDTLGMRGTCSEGFVLRAEVPVAQILPKPFAEIAAQSMLASSHLLWASLWSGIAANALQRAQAFVRAAARKQPGSMPPGALRLAETAAKLQQMQALTADGLRRYAQARADGAALASMGFSVAMNNVKLGASRMANEIVGEAMQICGLAGFKNGTPYSLGRHMRDLASAPLMISNDRILGNTSTMLLVHRLDTNIGA